MLLVIFSHANCRALELARDNHQCVYELLLLSLEVCVSPKKASIIIIIIMNADQGSLSFQLMGGLYDFGRALCLLSTVTGLTVPPHNFMAVHKLHNYAQKDQL